MGTRLPQRNAIIACGPTGAAMVLVLLKLQYMSLKAGRHEESESSSYSTPVGKLMTYMFKHLAFGTIFTTGFFIYCYKKQIVKSLHNALN